ncbi:MULTISPECIES: fimbrial protein [unclassified Pseudomonas]|uniref:fimbrial protein n=1 Tax=unclassified Pseudomonas TaxID=196821 RepID=UPI001B32F0E9|nr:MULTISPECIES: fimbrial protein [unclassified Pseudomonas]MBP5946876.1 type 1 fimbrial protein [Pseudomonas sp. P9(2020)]MBZ9565014.1 type 1 fimbrial protein [Pseudomonas sp. P116]
MKLWIALLAWFIVPNAWGYCVFALNDDLDKIRDYGAHGPGSQFINTPRDATGLPVIYTESLPVVGSKMIITCPFKETLGLRLNPAIGAQPNFSTSLFRLKDTGIALQFFLDSNAAALVPLQFSDASIWLHAKIPTPAPQLRVVQTGPIKEGAVIPAGLLASLVSSDDQTFATFNLSNPVYIVAGACKTPNVSVDMTRDNKTSSFKKIGSKTNPVAFNIQLVECPNFLKSVKYSIKANTKVIDANKGVISLDASSTAKGIGLQVSRGDDQPVVIGKEYNFAGYDRAGGDFNIPFSASYIQTDASIEAGIADTSLTFVMSYQ